MTARHEFRNVTRRNVSGAFVGDRLELADVPPRTSTAFPGGLYAVDGSAIVVVDEPMDLSQYEALTGASVPPWADAVVGSALLTEEREVPPRIEVLPVLPTGIGDARAGFAAACASHDDGFHDANPLDCLVRVNERVLSVRAERDPSTRAWSGIVEEADEADRREMAHWRLYRSVDSRPGWGGWDDDGFHLSTSSPYDVARMVHFGIVPLDGLEIAVVQEPLTGEQGEMLAAAPRPAWIDALAVSRLLTPSHDPLARIRVDLIQPSGVNTTTIAAAVAASHVLHGRFDVEAEACTVEIGDEDIRVVMTPETGADRHTWSLRTRPVHP